MANLNTLKHALRETIKATASSSKQPLSDTQYSDGFDVLVQGLGVLTYKEFIIPQLTQLLTPFLNSRNHISVLEIGPGSKSQLGYLPGRLRRKVSNYTAFEPNELFAARLEEWLCSGSETEPPLSGLQNPPSIHRVPFGIQDNMRGDVAADMRDDEKYDIILFCHSMYGMKLKDKCIKLALKMLVEPPLDGMVIVFHREALHIDSLVCQQMASFPTGVVSVANNDEALNSFAPFIAGFVMQDLVMDKVIRAEWRKICRALGRREEAYLGQLLFDSPNVMVAFTQHATSLSELMAQVPIAKGDKTVKNREACFRRPASIFRPTEIRHVQQCVQWALKHGVGLTIIGGGHSGNCLWTNVVSVDMSAFDQVHILTAELEDERKSKSDLDSLVVVESGCKTGDIITKAMAVGLTVPLGARPSVGAGLWLQGGIGHLSRLYGLASDAIVGAVVVGSDTGKVFCVGCVPSQFWPVGAVRPESETDLLWAIKGAGTNFGIVISVTFKAYTAPTFSVRKWSVPLSNNFEAKLSDFDEIIASKLPRNFSADAYLYWDNDQIYLGVTMLESFTIRSALQTPTPTRIGEFLGLEDNINIVDIAGLFDTEMYISGMHGGHSGKTSSFKRCLLLKHIGRLNVTVSLKTAIETRPTPLCYLHLLHGGGAIGDVAVDATAFGCRDWDFACVITGVWLRDQDGTEAARAAVRWVYNVVRDLLPLSNGAYGSDLGPDPRDAALAAKAFGPNQKRLALLKLNLDTYNVLAYSCPLLKVPVQQKLIIIITGESGAGKDYCADVWVSMFTRCMEKSLIIRTRSISDVTKREYAAATGADLNCLLWDRAYKEQHRPALTKFFQSQVRQRPWLLEEHFLNIVYGAAEADVLLITGMRDKAPVAVLSHLVPDSRLLEVYINAKEETRQIRRGYHDGDDSTAHNDDDNNNDDNGLGPTALNYRPSLIFDNDTSGSAAATVFGKSYLLPFIHKDLQQLAHMVRQVSNFPHSAIEFRHVLGISQQPGGLALCTALLQTHFTGNWAIVDTIACCEAGGFIYASALALRTDIPLLLIREAGKLPPPIISVTKRSSNISSLSVNDPKEKQIEIERNMVSKGRPVVVVDDVLATGETLCAVLQLLDEAGVSVEDISIIVVAEFPIHRGRDLLRQRGFGRVTVQSLLIFGDN